MEYTQSVRKLISSAGFILLAAGSLIAQTNLLVVSGTVRDDDSGRKLPGSVVIVYQDDEEIDRKEVDKNASYEYELPLGFSYTFAYEREGFIAKKVVLDVTHTPDDESVDGFGFDLDMNLFKYIDGFDISILDTPMGIGTYDPDSKRFTFNTDHTDRMKMRVENEINRLASIDENREKNKRAFDVAMKAGENATKKKKWQEALGHFNQALELIPDEEEAIENRDKCREELDNIEAKAAERKAEEDVKKAEEEADKALKEAERLAREEEARKRKEEAEERRRGLQNPEQTIKDDTEENTEEDDEFVPREREVEVDNSDDRKAQEQADIDARRQAVQGDAAADAEKRRKEKEEQAKRAELLSKSANNTSDDADHFFREALKSENQARAAEIEQRKQDGKIRSQQREEEAKSRGNVMDVVDARRSHQEFIDSYKNTAQNTRAYYAEQITSQKQKMQVLNKKIQKSPQIQKLPQQMYEGRAAEHQDEIEYTQSLLNAQTIRNKVQMDQRRIDANSGGYEVSQVRNTVYRGEYERNAGTPILNKKDEEHPKGFHEYSYEIPNGTVIEFTSREGDKVVRYKKVLMKTGTFYFRNNRSITASIFNRETAVVHD